MKSSKFQVHSKDPAKAGPTGQANSKKNGFTLIELLVVVTIIIILTVITTINYRSGQRQLALQRASYKLGQDIRKIQSIAGLEETGCVGVVDYQYGYGIHLDTGNPKSYILFADCNGNEIYNGAIDINIETIEFEKEVEISSLTVANPLDIVFAPPDPSVFINGNGMGIAPDLAVITIHLEKEIAKTKTISVYKSGLIDAD